MDFLKQYFEPYKKYLYTTGFIGLLASLIVGTGEFLVHYSSGGYSSEVSFGFFNFVPESRLAVGHYLIILGLPLYLIGYIHIFLALQTGSRKLATAVFVLGVFAFMIGGVWVGSRGFLGSVVHTLQGQENKILYDEIVGNYNFYMENLVQILRVLVLLLSGTFVFAILKYKTLYPKWMAAFNPFLILAIVFLLFLFVPAIGNFLIPTAMNVAHFVLFSVSLFALSRTLNKEVVQ